MPDLVHGNESPCQVMQSSTQASAGQLSAEASSTRDESRLAASFVTPDHSDDEDLTDAARWDEDTLSTDPLEGPSSYQLVQC